MHYPAELYAAVHSGNAGDVAFYSRLCAGASSVLELGCGDGRVSRRLLAPGRTIVGLDLSTDALQIARSRGVPVVCADMARFALAQQFERILVPYNGLCCLLTPAALDACLGCVAEHLAPGGELVFDVYNADGLRDEDAWRSTSSSELAPVDALGTTWTVHETSTLDTESQRADATYRHIAADGRPPVEACIAQRYLLSEELPDLLADAGLMLRSLHGGFNDEPFSDHNAHLVVRAGHW